MLPRSKAEHTMLWPIDANRNTNKWCAAIVLPKRWNLRTQGLPTQATMTMILNLKKKRLLLRTLTVPLKTPTMAKMTMTKTTRTMTKTTKKGNQHPTP